MDAPPRHRPTSSGGPTQEDDDDGSIAYTRSRTPSEIREAAVAVRDQVAARMTPDPLAEAQRRARVWTPTLEPLP